MPVQDWAYLAGMIDGEGTIYVRRSKSGSFQGCVRVYQKDPSVLEYLKELFQVGEVNFAGGQTNELGGKEYVNGGHQWGINSVLEIRWILNGVLPFLRVKQAQAAWAIEIIRQCLEREGTVGAPLKKVWGQEWPGRFRANYMDRFWPRLEGGNGLYGVEGKYGDLNDFVNLLAREPDTRQAWFPIFHPDETGSTHGGRVMCTLGYQVLVRDGEAHMWYPLRSCDLRRHWRDDVYLAIRLLLWTIERCRGLSNAWQNIQPGSLAMHMTSLHVFENDWRELMEGKQW
jgi:hypothetical protein